MDNPDDLSARFSFDSAAGALPASEPVTWSPAARRRLTIALAAGALVAVIGLMLVLERFRITTVLDVLKPMLGVALAFAGGLVAVQSYRLLKTSTPDRLYRPRDPNEARSVFVGVWLVGSILLAVLSVQSLAAVKPALVIGTTVGVVVMGVGALWLYRWIGATAEGEWPVDEASQTIQARPVEWSVFWAFVWGVFSTVLAIGAEVVLLLVGLQYFAFRLPVPVADANVSELIADPGFVLGVFVAVCLIAPLLEEIFKALGLWLLRGAIRSHGDGLLLGLAAGLGFGFVESAGNMLQGVGNWLILALVWMRLATMLMHSVTTGLIGAGYARARLTGDRRALLSGLLRAVVVHGGWNVLGVIVVFAGLRGDNCLPLVVLGAIIVLAVRIVPRVVKAAIDRAIQDDHAIAGVPLPGAWSPLDDGVWWRLAGGRPQFPPLSGESLA
jgi:RsiW-degrading membrane proteinase PrsW (M82 family)